MMDSKLKKRKISEGECSDSGVDIISNLGDSILSIILSFLPTTKEAVATSILSKRWKYVWTNVDNLVFVSYGLSKEAMEHLPRAVYEVLKHNQGNVKGFEIGGRTLCGHGVYYNEVDAISWVNTAISRGVEKLHVDIGFRGCAPPVWPVSVFSCKTLVDLMMWSLDGKGMDIPSTPIFPCLKKLQIMYCDSEFSKCIVSGCAVLEHLVVHLDYGNYLDIVSSSIKRLEIECDMDNYVDHEITLSVPSLQYLWLRCPLPLEFIVEEKLSSLIEADISFWEYLDASRDAPAKEIQDSFVRVMQLISNVKILRIASSCFKFFNSVGHGLFVNLTKLEIISEFFEWKLLRNFMANSINLEDIRLEKTSSPKKHKLAWRKPKEVPASLASSLRKISIHEYNEDTLSMVSYVLRNAQILEQVDIHCATCYRRNKAWKSDMLRKLQKLQRASARCEIVLV